MIPPAWPLEVTIFPVILRFLTVGPVALAKRPTSPVLFIYIFLISLLFPSNVPENCDIGTNPVPVVTSFNNPSIFSSLFISPYLIVL